MASDEARPGGLVADPGWTATGPEGAPPVVLVHGSRLTRAVWGPVSQRLASEFRVIALDLPGHGTRGAEPFSPSGAAAVIATVIDEAAGGRAVVVGHSLGGYAAMELAATSPGRVRGLVIAGASQEPGGPWQWAFRTLAWLFDGPLVGPLNWLTDRYFRFRFRAEVAEPLIAAGYWTRAGATGIRALTSRRYRQLLAVYPGPTLIVNGELDLILRLGARSFRAAARNARSRVIRRATHLAQLDRPHAFATLVTDFARSLEA
jgi:pimeloyl-ACP methyl ester carboxylesterase